MGEPYRKWLHEDAAYIITDQERAAFQQLSTDAEREQFVEQFWQVRGPAVKEEHYRRIAYANEHFASSVPGWETDRGRIYITYGPPDEIDARVTADAFPLQSWRYNHIEGLGNNIVVAFVNRTGDFHMTSDPSEARTPYQKWLNEDVAYIITDQERAAFKQLSTDPEREQFIEQFWQRRDPTPGTVENEYKEEHYRRIAYANQNFSDGVPGWKTDRGRIYIAYGPPDQAAASGCCSLTWTYRYIDGIGENITVAFQDSQGNGEFRLTPGSAIR
jgi:GWxTD domain-containing protein